jgi:hypothetical protein
MGAIKTKREIGFRSLSIFPPFVVYSPVAAAGSTSGEADKARLLLSQARSKVERAAVGGWVGCYIVMVVVVVVVW